MRVLGWQDWVITDLSSDDSALDAEFASCRRGQRSANVLVLAVDHPNAVVYDPVAGEERVAAPVSRDPMGDTQSGRTMVRRLSAAAGGRCLPSLIAFTPHAAAVSTAPVDREVRYVFDSRRTSGIGSRNENSPCR